MPDVIHICEFKIVIVIFLNFTRNLMNSSYLLSRQNNGSLQPKNKTPIHNKQPVTIQAKNTNYGSFAKNNYHKNSRNANLRNQDLLRTESSMSSSNSHLLTKPVMTNRRKEFPKTVQNSINKLRRQTDKKMEKNSKYGEVGQDSSRQWNL